MRRWMRFGLVAVVLALCVVPVASQQGKPDGSGFDMPKPDELQEQMKRWMETFKTNEYHQWLGQFVGSWTTTTRVWMGGPKPAETTGTAEIAWKFPNRWLEVHTKGVLMDKPYESYGLHGYDNYRRKYVTTTIDGMQTAMLRFEGTLDRSGKVLMQYGTLDEPMTGEHDKMAKVLTRVLSPDEFVVELHDLAIGEQNTKVMEWVYTRK